MLWGVELKKRGEGRCEAVLKRGLPEPRWSDVGCVSRWLVGGVFGEGEEEADFGGIAPLWLVWLAVDGSDGRVNRSECLKCRWRGSPPWRLPFIQEVVGG